MNPSREVFYVAVGERAKRAQAQSVAALRQFCDLPVRVIGQAEAGLSDKQASRWAKLSLDQRALAPQSLYLDADTLPRQDLSAGFEMLSDGWDLVIAPSAQQGDDCLWHVGAAERAETFDELGYIPLQLQAGVLFIAWNKRTRAMWQAWRAEYMRYQDEDQAALLRALSTCPVKVWLLGYPWNGGAAIEHRCGMVRR